MCSLGRSGWMFFLVRGWCGCGGIESGIAMVEAVGVGFAGTRAVGRVCRLLGVTHEGLGWVWGDSPWGEGVVGGGGGGVERRDRRGGEKVWYMYVYLSLRT